MSTPGTWETWATGLLLEIVEANSCQPWPVLRDEMVSRGPNPNGTEGSWPYKAWLKAKRKVLSGEAWGLTPELPPRTHSEAVGRMLRAFGDTA